ncbi:MAG: calcium-binding protein [Hyphomonadaceae bacterium]|nr:calcium-binding protein [Hyphomonadaceae bacterium]
MATVTSGAFGIDLTSFFDFAHDPTDGTVITHTATTWAVDFGGGTVLTWTGSSLTYDSNHIPNAGSFSDLVVTFNGSLYVAIHGLTLGVAGYLSNIGFTADLLDAMFENSDTITGSAASDAIMGWRGTDTIHGGGGNDTISGDDFLSFPLQGNDILYGDAGDDIITGDLGNDVISGGSGVDNLSGGGGNDTIHGDAAADFLNGGTGSDVIDGGAGIDRISFTGSVAVTVDLTNTGAQLVSTYDGLKTLTSIENVLTGGFNDTIIGNDVANVLNGNTGDDTVSGGGGNDSIAIVEGADVIDGGNGIDTAYVGFYIFADNTGVMIDLSLTSAQDIGDGRGSLTLTNVENLTGSDFGDTLIGNSGANVLDGGIGADQLTGRGGNDTYVIDSAGDQITEVAAGGTADLVLSSITRTLTANLENLTLTGTSVINGTGNTLANVIIGNTGGNILKGGDGADTLSGGGGDDALYGQTGQDSLTGGAGRDAFVLNSPLTAANADTITDFSVPADTIKLENSVFTELGGAGVLATAKFFIGANAHAAADRIIYNSSTGALYYDGNGNASGGKTLIATLDTGLALTHNDFVVI